MNAATLCRSALLACACLLAAPLCAASAYSSTWKSRVDADLLAAAASGRSDFLIELSARPDLSAATRAKAKADKGRAVVQALKANAAQSQAGVIAVLKARGLSYKPYWIANVISTQGTLADIQAIAQLAGVNALQLLQTRPGAVPAGRHKEQPKARSVTAAAAAAAVAATIEPSLTLVRAPQVWAQGFRGQGVVVGDHDIGVQWDHPALKAKYRGWDAASGTADHRYSWHNAFGALDLFCTDPAVPCDSNGHGTHTTGTMVGDDPVSGMQIGMAPGAQWIACRSLLDPVVGAGTVPTYLECMEWTLAPYPTGDSAAADPAKAPDVVNNSWGCAEVCAPPILQDVNEAIEAAGIVQVVSAGNDGDTCNTILYPLAVYDSSFTVGATDNSDAMASFSSRGAVLSDLSMRVKPNVVAPGVDTLSSWNDGAYNTISGTSMAGPHVAGLVALVMSAEPKLIGRVRDVRSLIEQTAVPVVSGETCSGTSDSDIPNNTWGYGRIDALAAVDGRPRISVTATAPATADSGAVYDYVLSVTEPASARIPLSNVKLDVSLPAGVTYVSESEAGSVAATTRSYSRAALAPGETWSVSLKLKSDTAGTRSPTAKAEADQASSSAANPSNTAIGGGSGSGGGGGGLGLGTIGGMLTLLFVNWMRKYPKI